MERRGTPVSPATVHAVAVTSGGVETIHADASNDRDPRWLLMNELGSAYRNSDKLEDDSPTALNQQIAAVSTQLVQALPPSLQRVFTSLNLHDPLVVQTQLIIAQSEEPGSRPDMRVPVREESFMVKSGTVKLASVMLKSLSKSGLVKMPMPKSVSRG